MNKRKVAAAVLPVKKKPGEPWADREKQIVRDFYPSYGGDLLAASDKLPGRSADAIRRIANKEMNLHVDITLFTQEKAKRLRQKRLFDDDCCFANTEDAKIARTAVSGSWR